MSLSWNEVRSRARGFSHQWAGSTSEGADKQTFWNEFFEVFGIKRRSVACFEVSVKNLSGNYDRIDLFWKGTLLVEHKSAGKNLGQAESQAFDYIQSLISQKRNDEIPRYVIVSDFRRIALYDLEPDIQTDLPIFCGQKVHNIEFTLSDFADYVREFAFIKGEKSVKIKPEDPVNIDAAMKMANLHDALEAGGFRGHDLERFLVRILFCLFAEDTSIFEPSIFHSYIENRTAKDGSDLGTRLERLFNVLDTPVNERQVNLDEELQEFPYVNGNLFSERLDFADFNKDMRDSLLSCSRFNWSKVSPAVFGSMFQGIMDDKERRQIGAHYTSEKDILKLINSLFLDDLKSEFESIKSLKGKTQKERYIQFHRKLASLKFFDPACGCGNFLVISYREIRKLETALLKETLNIEQTVNINELSLIDVDNFYGIEIGEWPARIAEVALWLMDHQMNTLLAETFEQYYVRLPLKKTPQITVGNALRLDWKNIILPEKCSYILGNPPFVGSKLQNPEQKQDMLLVAKKIKSFGLLDYVTGWYFKAAQFIKDTPIRVAFVSTNSITQGEQVGVLWNSLIQQFHIHIHFAHRTFAWESEAKGKAHVHVVIIGFGYFDAPNKRIYDYEDDIVSIRNVNNISPYLVDGPNYALTNRSKPISIVPQIVSGNKPIDDGNYLFSEKEKRNFISIEPLSESYFFRWVGSQEFINNEERWCLFLGNCTPHDLNQMPEVKKRVKAVQLYRENSISAPTRKIALTPTRFHVENIPVNDYLLIPSVSSEKRKYIPISFMPPSVIASNLCLIIPNASLYHFGILTSSMHMAWVRQVCGRLESRYRYSGNLVYNNYPWPLKPTKPQIASIEEAGQSVLDVRAEHPSSTLADLYDPLSMPPDLVKAHQHLDSVVDKCYRQTPFQSDRSRVEFLFNLYEQITAPLNVKMSKKTKAEQ